MFKKIDTIGILVVTDDKQALIGIILSDDINHHIFLEQLEFFIYELQLPIIYRIVDIHSIESETLNYNLYISFLYNEELLNLLAGYTKLLLVHDSEVKDLSQNINIVLEQSTVVILLNTLYVIEKILPENDNILLAYYILIELLSYNLFDLINMTENKFKLIHENYKNPVQNYLELYLIGKIAISQDNAIRVTGQSNISLDLRKFHFVEIDKIRLDPDNKPCAIKNCKFSVEYEDGEIIQLTDFHSNPDLVKYDTYYFNSGIAEINFSFNRVNPIYFHCAFDIEQLSDTAFVREEKWFEVIRNYYQIRKDYYLNVIKRINNNPIVNHQLSGKSIYIHLGPDYIGINGLHESILNNLGQLISYKIMYPTHQKDSLISKSRGGLFNIFTKLTSGNIVFDSRKLTNLVKNLNESKFNNLLLSSADFLEENRLEYFCNVLKDTSYIYYLRDTLESCFEDYKLSILYSRETRKFQEVLYINKQFQEIFNIIKF